MLSEDTAAPLAPANADTSSATAGEAKPKKAPVKLPPRNAAKSTDAKKASSDPIEALAPGADVASEVPAKVAPKRRGKLGLFGKGQGADAGTSADTPAFAEIAAPSSDPTKSGKSAKVTKPKRMARTPKAPDTETD